jgi:ATP-dependent protease HslVU (ClpYQ) peptidase subunit
MSIVVAVKKKGRMYVASDSLSVFGAHCEDQSNIVNNQKIMEIGSALLGYAGWGLYGNIFGHYLASRKSTPRLGTERQIFAFFLQFIHSLKEQYNLVNDQAGSEKDPFSDMDSSFLVANRNGIFGVSSNLSVCQYRNFHAIGSGCDYAFGVLHALYDGETTAREIARIAVEAAVRFDSSCGGDIVIKQVKQKGRETRGGRVN